MSAAALTHGITTEGHDGIVVRQQDLGGAQAVDPQLVLPEAHEPPLADGRRGLLLSDVLGTGPIAQFFHPCRDGARRDEEDLEPLPFQL